MDSIAKKLLVLGVGNLIMGDEGVGVQVVQRLAREPLPDCVECLDGGTGGFFLLEKIQEATRIILIDAAAFDDHPGSVRRLNPRYSKEYPRTLTPHDTGVKDLLDCCCLMGIEVDIRLIAITIDPRQQLSMKLSAEIDKAVETVVHLVQAEIKEFTNHR